MGSGYCDFCHTWHSASCYHPGRVALNAKESEVTARRAEVERMKGAANRFAEGRISAGKLAEELGVEDKHGFKSYARSFDEEWDLLSATKAEVERLKAELENERRTVAALTPAANYCLEYKPLLLKAEAEVARLRAALEEIAGADCWNGNATCREVGARRSKWCLSCVASAALEAKP